MMRMILLAAAVLGFSTSHAHHSVAGMYDDKREIALDGVITEFYFVNPHPYILIDVKSADGPQQWKLEMDNRFEMSAIGMTQETFKAGDRIIVSGNPTAQPSRTVYIQKLQRPADGYGYEQVGFSPRLNSQRK